MTHTIIKNVWDIVYVCPEEIVNTKNSKEVLEEYSSSEEIPLRVLELKTTHKEKNFIVLAGDGALFPWQRGQRVEAECVDGLILYIEFLRELCVRGIDNTRYQDFLLYDTIIPVKQGKYFRESDDKVFRGLLSLDIYKELADSVLDDNLPY